MEPPRQPLVDDLHEFFSLPPFPKRIVLQPEELSIRIDCYEDPALAFVKVELAKQKSEQKDMEATLQGLKAAMHPCK